MSEIIESQGYKGVPLNNFEKSVIFKKVKLTYGGLDVFKDLKKPINYILYANSYYGSLSCLVEKGIVIKSSFIYNSGEEEEENEENLFIGSNEMSARRVLRNIYYKYFVKR